METVPEPADHVETEPSLIYDLFTYLVYLQNHDVRLYADGRLGRRDLETLRRRLTDAGERRLTFLRHLADRLEFVIHQDGCLRLEAAAVKRWLTAAPAHQLAALQVAWRDDADWNDLCRVPGLVCDQETPWRNDPIATRQAVLALLARCPLDAWWSLDSFVAAVKSFHPDFQRPDGDYASWYVRDVASGDYLSGFGSWEHVEGALLTDLLTGPLCWLGIVATVAAASGAVCRLTEAGERFLGLLSGELETAPSPPIVVRPDFGVEFPPPTSLYTQFQLERFTEFQSRDPLRYRLTVGSLWRALERGVRVEQVVAFLRQASEGRVPGNVVGQLQMWAGRFGQVEFQEVALLMTRSEHVLKELSVLPETRSLIGQVLSPTSALVRKTDLPRLKKALRKLGFLAPEEPVGERTERG